MIRDTVLLMRQTIQHTLLEKINFFFEEKSSWTLRCILGKQRSKLNLHDGLSTRLTGVPRDFLRITGGALSASSR